MIFEEIVIWRRMDAQYAVRHFGFRDLSDGRVWIALANHLGIDDHHDLTADEMIAAQSALEALLNDLPTSADRWSTTKWEAVKQFDERQAVEMDRPV